MKKLIALAVVVLLCIGGFFGYQQHQKQELIKSATPIVKETTLRTQQIIDFLLAPSNATFAEVFNKADETVQKIGELIITLESQNREANPDAIAAAAEYLKSTQTLTRSINSFTRMKFDFNSASSRADDALEELKSTNEYTRKYARERLGKSIKQMESATEKMSETGKKIKGDVEVLTSARTNAEHFFPADALLPTKALEDLAGYFAASKKQEQEPK